MRYKVQVKIVNKFTIEAETADDADSKVRGLDLYDTLKNSELEIMSIEQENPPPSYGECETLADSLCETVRCVGDSKSSRIVFQSLYEFYQLCPAGFYRDQEEHKEGAR